MDMHIDLTEILIASLGILLSLVAYFLRQKDEEQAKHITDLYEKHHTDAERLHQVELKLASDHYQKTELDGKFDKMETMVKHGFETLGAKFDVLSATLVAHITKEEVAKKP